MATPTNMAAITASLERSLRNCSLNHHQQPPQSSSTTTAAVGEAPHGFESPPNNPATAVLDLNSEASLPFHWEQCLDLKTGEIYYINWRTGMKAKEDPRKMEEYGDYGYYYSEDDSSSYDSQGSCTESSPSSSRVQWCGDNNGEIEKENCYYQESEEGEKKKKKKKKNSNSNVLVVAGCKSCLMYYMVPKQLEICPKCCGQLLHFDRSENGSS